MIDPAQLLEHAQQELNLTGRGAPRQVELRRAGSTAYYAVFHCLCGAAAQALVPAVAPNSRIIVYRALEHGKANERCQEMGRSPMKDKLQKRFTRTAFEPRLRGFSTIFQELQELRHSCDYDPSYKAAKGSIERAIQSAGQAIRDFQSSDPAERLDFLVYLLFGHR